MKFLMVTLIASMMILFSMNLAAAERYEINVFKYAYINTSGKLVKTNTNVEGVDIMGFVCLNKNCSSVRGQLWNGETLHTDTHRIMLTYPTTLLSPSGYGIYMFKEGYIPYEVKTNYWGTNPNDPIGPVRDYLTKREHCRSLIKSTTIRSRGGEIFFNATIAPPIMHSGPLTYVPEEIEEHYETEVLVSVRATRDDHLFFAESETVRVPFSENLTVPFTLEGGPGDYSIVVTTNVTDEKCLRSTQQRVRRLVSYD